MDDTSLKIGELATLAGVGVDTVRFYERAGLLPKPARTASGYRHYGADDVRRLRFIRRAKALGFSLDEIAELLRLERGRGSRAQVKAMAERRIAELDRRLAELGALRETLARHAARCDGTGPVEGCPITQAILDSTLEHTACTLHDPAPIPRTPAATRKRR